MSRKPLTPKQQREETRRIIRAMRLNKKRLRDDPALAWFDGSWVYLDPSLPKFERNLGILKQWVVDGFTLKQLGKRHKLTPPAIRAAALSADKKVGVLPALKAIEAYKRKGDWGRKRTWSDLELMAECHELPDLAAWARFRNDTILRSKQKHKAR